MLLRRIAVAVLLVLAAPAHSASPEPSLTGLGVRLVDAPTDRRDDPRAQVYVVDHVQPGDTLSRRIEVANRTGGRARVSLYPAASEVADAEFSVLPGATSNELTGWTRVTPAAVELDSGEIAVVTVTIDVPADAGGGERYAAVMAEIEETSATSGLTVANRVGVRVYLSVGGAKEPTSDFEITTLQAMRQPDGRPAVTAQVRNTGQRALDMSGVLRLTQGPGGLSAGPFPAQLGATLAPGGSSAVEVVLDKAIVGGPWLATLTLGSGRIERAAKASVTFPDEAGGAAAPVEAEALPLAADPRVVIPVAGGLIGLILLGLVLLLFYRRRRRTRDEAVAAAAAPLGTAPG